jgi:hypothetical protein
MTKDELAVSLEKEIKGMKIRVRMRDEADIDRAYALMKRLSDRIESITDAEEEGAQLAEMDAQIKDAIRKTTRFRSEVDGQPRIAGITNDAYAIGVSLLGSHPENKRPIQITSELQIHSGRVSRVLTGSRGDYARYFRKGKDGYKLNQEGMRWMLEEVVPFLSGEEMDNTDAV